MFTISGSNRYGLFSGEDELLKTFKIAVIHIRNTFGGPVPRAVGEKYKT